MSQIRERARDMDKQIGACEFGSPLSELKELFPTFDFGSMVEDWFQVTTKEEQRPDFQKRALSFLSILVDYCKQNPNGNVVVVGHCNYFGALCGWGKDIQNCEVRVASLESLNARLISNGSVVVPFGFYNRVETTIRPSSHFYIESISKNKFGGRDKSLQDVTPSFPIFRCVGGHFSELILTKGFCALQSSFCVSTFHPRMPHSILNHSMKYTEGFLLNSIFHVVQTYKNMNLEKNQPKLTCIIGAAATFIPYFSYLFENIIFLPLQFSLNVKSESEIRKILDYSSAFGIPAQAHVSIINDQQHHQWEALATFKLETIPQIYLSFLNEIQIDQIIWTGSNIQSKSFIISKNIYLSLPLPTAVKSKNSNNNNNAPQEEEERENEKLEETPTTPTNSKPKTKEKELVFDWKVIGSCLSDLIVPIQQSEMKETCHVDFGVATKLSKLFEMFKSSRSSVSTSSSRVTHLFLEFNSHDSMNLITQLLANKFFQQNQLKLQGFVLLVDFSSQPLFELMNGYLPVSIESKQFVSKEIFHNIHQLLNFISNSQPQDFVSEHLNSKSLIRKYQSGVEIFVPIPRQHEGIASRIEERIKQSHFGHFKLNERSKEFWNREDFYISSDICEGYVKLMSDYFKQQTIGTTNQSEAISNWDKKTKKLALSQISQTLMSCPLFQGSVEVIID